MDTDLLVVENISKNFAGLRALQDVSLQVRCGEILGLIGPNGSGKTTLINVITGLLPATSGQVRVGNLDLTNRKPHDIARSGISRTFQTIRLFHELTVFENLLTAAIGVGCSRKEAKRRAETALEDLNLQGWGDKWAGELPYGLERRVEVARALAMHPKFLLLDEPAAGLNEGESDDLLETLAPIPAQKNLGMLIVEHDMRLIMRLCHRLHVLNYGRTIGQGTPEEVRAIPDVVQAYLRAAH